MKFLFYSLLVFTFLAPGQNLVAEEKNPSEKAVTKTSPWSWNRFFKSDKKEKEEKPEVKKPMVEKKIQKPKSEAVSKKVDVKKSARKAKSAVKNASKSVKKTVLKLPQTLKSKTGIKLKLIQPGKFQLGSAKATTGRMAKEIPRHSVEITQSYYLGKFEITQGEWKRVMGDNPSRFNKCGSECPVESVSWDEVQAFLKRLNQMEGGEVFRLPTEAEWEMAARAGTKTAYFFGDNPKELKKHAWFDGNSVGGIAKVGLKKANSWGLYDMHGNVSEWVSDWFSIYGSEALKDPGGPSGGSKKVVRGGCWYDDPSNCRSAFRVGKEPSAKNGYQGFRILRTTKDLLEKQKKKSAKKELKKDVSKKRMSLHKKK